MPTRITVNDLRVADIIVSTTGAAISGAIRGGSGADVSHAALFTTPNYVIEAIGDGVIEHTFEIAYREATLAIALRRRNMTEELKRSVVENARQFAGLPYDAVGAAGAGLTTNRGSLIGGAGCILSPLGCLIGSAEVIRNASQANRDLKFFCSELVARAYEMAGIPISNQAATYTTPRAIRTSSQLIYVGHLIGG